MNEITIVDVPTQNVLGIRKCGSYKMIPQLLAGLFQHAMVSGAHITGMPAFVCHELSKEAVMEADAKGTADIEVIVPVATAVGGSDDVRYYELAGGKMARIIHKGPYEACEQAYDRLFVWIAEEGRTVCGPTREVYLNDPRTVRPEEILTEIYAPID